MARNALSVCPVANCPELVQRGTRCPAHTRLEASARGTTTARGYGYTHQRTRARIAPLVAAGRALCARCGLRISPLEAWDLGHDDDDRTRYTGPEHAACNRATKGRT